MEGIQCLGRLVQRHGHTLFVILVGGGGVGRHLQRIKDGDDLVDRKGDAIVELLVSFAGGALAVVVVLGSHPQQLFFGLGRFLLGCFQLCLCSFQVAVLLEPAVLLRILGFRCLGCGRSLFSGCFRCGLLSGLWLCGGFRLRGLLGFFAHSRSSL